MNPSAFLATITTTVVAAALLMLPAAHGANGPALPCAQTWRLDPAGRHWLMATRFGEDNECPAQPLVERARQLEHDPLR